MQWPLPTSCPTGSAVTDTPETAQLLDRMADALRAMDIAALDPVVIGIHTGGVWVADALASRLALDGPLGTINISFYRDDFSRIGLHPQIRPSDLPVSVDNRVVLLVDDVLHTGRTIRAAMNELFDYGRPDRILLAVLATRPGRELPIAPDVVGHVFDALPAGGHLRLTGPDPLALRIEVTA